jgi:PAS domain S-box-containing protein
VLENTSRDLVDILLVDDRTENLMTLETVLASPDYRLIKAESGDEALRYLLDHEPALILMDVQMPDLDGFETASMIKKSERTRDIPIIFVTAINKDERYVHQGYAQGAIDYIYKPYDANILKAKVSVFADLARKSKRLIEAERQLRKTEKKERERQITELELKSLRREQAEQKKYLDLVQGISHGIVWAADAESLAISFVSPSAEKILGYPTETWRKEPSFFAEHIYPLDRQMVMDSIEKAKAERSESQIEHRLITASGDAVWFHTQFRMARKSEGAGYEVRGLSVDITQIKDSQEVLRQNKIRSDFLAQASFVLGQSLDFEKSLNQLANLIVPECADGFSVHLLDSKEQLNGLVLNFKSNRNEGLNDALADLGMNEVLLGSTAKLWIHVSDEVYQRHDLRLKSAILVPLVVHDKTFGVMSLLKSRIDSNYNEDDLAMAKDLASRVVVAIENASLHQMAQAAVRVRDDFLSVASHELKTPLTPLKLQAEMLSRLLKGISTSDLKLEKVDKTLKTFDRQLDRLSYLIDELLDISKMTNGKMSLNLEEFDLIELVRDIVGRLSEQMESAKCDISLDVTIVDPLMVYWDRFRIEQVIINLLTNAAKYGQGKPIHLSIWSEKENVCLSVTDGGIGIAEEDQGRIFNRFERAVSGRHFAGLGLGLYIVKQLLEAHGGKIAVKSKLNEGSVFTITIPEKAVVLPLEVPAYESNSLYFSGQYAIPKSAEFKS